jgi:hypothetical protein
MCTVFAEARKTSEGVGRGDAKRRRRSDSWSQTQPCSPSCSTCPQVQRGRIELASEQGARWRLTKRGQTSRSKRWRKRCEPGAPASKKVDSAVSLSSLQLQYQTDSNLCCHRAVCGPLPPLPRGVRPRTPSSVSRSAKERGFRLCASRWVTAQTGLVFC